MASVAVYRAISTTMVISLPLCETADTSGQHLFFLVTAPVARRTGRDGDGDFNQHDPQVAGLPAHSAD
jgi:hypothetical protein